jgi:peptide chain release factor subunit 3
MKREKKIEKLKPAFCKSQTKLICRITPKNPIALEKYDVIQQMGRFTLRDEGRTICVGKVLKYKPYSKGVVGASTQV